MGGKYSKILRGPHQVAFDITNRCNLRCRHCFNSSGENAVMHEELGGEEIHRLALSLVELHPSGCCICGGEPLLRLEETIDFISTLSPVTGVGMVSNGLLLTGEILEKLIDAGLQNIQFSIDGLRESHNRMRRQPEAFERTWQSLEMVMNEPRLAFSIAFCPTAFNIQDFEPLVERIHKAYRDSARVESADENLGFSFRVQPLMLLGRARKDSSLRPSYLQYRHLVELIGKKKSELEDGNRFRFEWGDPIEHIVAFQQGNVTMSQVSVRANGDITVSPYIPLVVGNVRRHSIEEYWNAGLSGAWDTPVVRELASRIYSISTMESLSDEICDINMGGDIETDIIDFDQLSDLSLLGKR